MDKPPQSLTSPTARTCLGPPSRHVIQRTGRKRPLVRARGPIQRHRTVPSRSERCGRWIGDAVEQSRLVDQHMIRSTGGRCTEIVDRPRAAGDRASRRPVDETGRAAQLSVQREQVDAHQAVASPAARTCLGHASDHVVQRAGSGRPERHDDGSGCHAMDGRYRRPEWLPSARHCRSRRQCSEH